MEEKEIKAKISTELHRRIGYALVERDVTLKDAIIQAMEQWTTEGPRAETPLHVGTGEAPLSKETQKIVKLLEGLGPKVRESVLVLVNAAVRNSEARSDSDPGEDSARQGEPNPKRDKKAS